ncbi:GNAT family N-acetyltransferase [Natronolimnohabitans innermongolicus]|uniref:N-acetyltransferase domain-containing protein n=1 Tax=Natronolimnohabitans innermongolicus JCM 12255 TaxID=1227499 RepID=L9WKR5_9EURY|nr:GNAT family N-acetyltransferase [Natronolimnohabitans innermongolicus]ELY48948.1 hypothetical protein C493_21166 [Natronolimnohabitans innermongolicus JCM 12255]
MSDSSPSANSCTIRPFDAGDRRAFLSLYEQVFDRERSAEWFRWRFEESPYVDHVPIVVADDGGEIVGCRSFFPLEVRVGGADRLALQPCDTMVHPDYRGQGLFSRMNAVAVDRYTDGDPAFCFNFPNDNAKPGNRKHGWKEIGTFPVYYRPQDPIGSAAKLTGGEGDDEDGDDGGGRGANEATTGAGGTEVEAGADDAWLDLGTDTDVDLELPFGDAADDGGVVDAIGNAITSSQEAGDQLLTDSPDALAIERFETPPADVLESIHRRAMPDGIHAARTAEFYRWRFANPARSYAAYVATRDGEAVAALVCSPVDDRLRIVETLPRDVDAESTAVDYLVAATLLDRSERNYVTAFGETLPSPIRYRFYPDTRFPLSTLIRPTARTLFARDLDGGVGIESTDASDWALSRLDLDTA